MRFQAALCPGRLFLLVEPVKNRFRVSGVSVQARRWPEKRPGGVSYEVSALTELKPSCRMLYTDTRHMKPGT